MLQQGIVILVGFDRKYRPVGQVVQRLSQAGGMRFDSQAGQIEHDGLPPLRHFLERSCV